MTQPIYPTYPPNLNEEQAQFLLTNLKDWSIAHGLAVRPAPAFVSASQDPSGVLAATAPVTLFPSLFPRHCFEEGFAIQKAYNELYAAIARDEDWLKSIVEECVNLSPYASICHIHLNATRLRPSYLFCSLVCGRYPSMSLPRSFTTRFIIQPYTADPYSTFFSASLACINMINVKGGGVRLTPFDL